jgi:hypothetical protein
MYRDVLYNSQAIRGCVSVNMRNEPALDVRDDRR